MFRGTVLAPILMGFDPQITLFLSGIGTLLFVITGLKVHSYLGSSFAFIGPVLAITVNQHGRSHLGPNPSVLVQPLSKE